MHKILKVIWYKSSYDIYYQFNCFFFNRSSENSSEHTLFFTKYDCASIICAGRVMATAKY